MGVEHASKECDHGSLPQRVHVNIKEISLVIIDTGKEEGHVGSWDEGNCVVMVGGWNLHESQLEGSG